MYLLEICVDSLASARAAISGGADRLELCSALALGGLTPYPELLLQIRRFSRIPVRCLIRPRCGDFLYTDDELELMAAQIRRLKASGADGFAIGCLTPEGELNRSAMNPLLRAADGAGLTLHRSIDVSRNPEQTYLAAAGLNIDTVLTSGGMSACSKGKETIHRLLELRDQIGGPEVLIGAGVNATVIRQFLADYPQARAFHMSGKSNQESGMQFRREDVPMGLPGLDEFHIPVTDQLAVRQAKEVLNSTIRK